MILHAIWKILGYDLSFLTQLKDNTKNMKNL